MKSPVAAARQRFAQTELSFIHDVLPTALLVCFLYWQLIPVLMASMGSSLDIKKLLVYPIPTGQLFTLEVVLRISTGVEMLLLLTGAGIGLLMNPRIPFWGPSALLVFVILNLFCSAGVRDLLVRLLARKRVREIVALLVVLPHLYGAPQPAEHVAAAPPALAQQFRVAATVVSFLFWAALGAATGYFRHRFAPERS